MKKQSKEAELLAALWAGEITKAEFLQRMAEPKSVSAICWGITGPDGEPSPEAEVQINFLGGSKAGQEETITWAEYLNLQEAWPNADFKPPIVFTSFENAQQDAPGEATDEKPPSSTTSDRE